VPPRGVATRCRQIGELLHPHVLGTQDWAWRTRSSWRGTYSPGAAGKFEITRRSPAWSDRVFRHRLEHSRAVLHTVNLGRELPPNRILDSQTGAIIRSKQRCNSRPGSSIGCAKAACQSSSSTNEPAPATNLPVHHQHSCPCPLHRLRGLGLADVAIRMDATGRPERVCLTCAPGNVA